MSDPSPQTATAAPSEAAPVDTHDATSASHSPVPLDNPPGPSNPTMPGESNDAGRGDPTRQTFRANADADLDAEVDAALGGTDVDKLVETSVEDSGAATAERLRGTQAGTVARLDLSKGEVLVDLGGKHQALVPSGDYGDSPPAEGEFVEVDIERYDPDEGLYRAHKKGAARRVGGWDELRVGQVVEAVVSGVNKGGLECRIGQTAIRAFMPAGQVDVQFHKDISTFLNDKVRAKITKLDKADRNVLLSRRAVVEAERREARDKTLGEIEEGSVLKGTVKTVKDFGAFVDLGGVDGLLHVSQLTHKRMADAAEFVKEGDEVEVRVDSLQKGGKGGAKIALSLSHRPPDPWEGADRKYAVGAQVTGRVTRVENFGCFVELEEGVEALLPASEMSWRRIRHPSEVTDVGEQLRLIVLTVEPGRRKMSLSLKQAAGDPWSQVAEKYPPGSVHRGRVTKAAEFGAFVEFETGVEGMIHISELSNNRVRRTEDVVTEGAEVNARVLQVDPEKRRLRLSLKERDEKAEQATVEDLAKRQTQKKDREKRLKKAPLKGGLDF